MSAFSNPKYSAIFCLFNIEYGNELIEKFTCYYYFFRVVLEYDFISNVTPILWFSARSLLAIPLCKHQESSSLISGLVLWLDPFEFLIFGQSIYHSFSISISISKFNHVNIGLTLSKNSDAKIIIFKFAIVDFKHVWHHYTVL